MLLEFSNICSFLSSTSWAKTNPEQKIAPINNKFLISHFIPTNDAWISFRFYGYKINKFSAISPQHLQLQIIIDGIIGFIYSKTDKSAHKNK